MTGGPRRRVVTGHDASGRGVVLSDGPPPHVREVADGATFIEVWSTSSTPAPVAATETIDYGIVLEGSVVLALARPVVDR